MIRCPKCSHEIADGSNFCAACGTALSTALPATEILSAGPRLAEEREDWRFAPGTLLGERYRVIALLGRGGMGEVYRASDVRLGQEVALKFLPSSREQDAVLQDRLGQEVRIARRITHANVCRVYDVSEIGGHPFISMEYIDGEDLASLLRRIGRLPQGKATQIARQICAGLAAAHDRGALHCDLKPANIMIDGRGRARITDFGLGALLKHAAVDAPCAGTPRYMAPEQLAGHPPTIQSDIYALGLLLYEIFTGKSAFPAATLGELRKLKDAQTYPRPSDLVTRLDPAMDQLIADCLAKESSRRPASAQAVATRLPGGDALSESLALGETPSPEEVADASPNVHVRDGIAGLLLIINLLGFALVLWMGTAVEFHRRVPPPRPPAALAERSREMLLTFGHAMPFKDEAYGFDYDQQYLVHLRAERRVSELWDDTRSRWILRFWYRRSPDYLVPERRIDTTHENWARGSVTYTDPAPNRDGMVSLRLDVMGKLLEFSAAPERSDSRPTRAPPDWSAFFAAAGLASEEWIPCDPVEIPPMAANAYFAWQPRIPTPNQEGLTLSAAAWHDQPVHFKVCGPWIEQPLPSFSSWSIPKAVHLITWLVAFFGSLYFGVRHWRSRRADRKGTWRLAIFVFIISALMWILEAAHVIHGQMELELLLFGLAVALQSAVRYGLMYAAVDPYFRKLWPHSLVPWSRMLGGRWRDGLVGRDILIGLALGMATYLLGNGALLLGARDRMLPIMVDLQTLSGSRFVWVNLFYSCRIALLLGLEATVLFLLLRALLRSRWLAAVILLLLALGTYATNMTTASSSLALIFAASIFVFTLVRYGLLAVIAHLFIGIYASRTPLTLDFTSWYAGTAILGLLVVVGIMIFAFSMMLPRRLSRGTRFLDR